MSLYFELIHEVVCLYVTCSTFWCGMSVGPSPPEITNLTVLGSRSIYLAWEAPKQFYRTIDHYYIEIRDTSTNLKQRRALENNEREVSFNSYVIKYSVNRHDCRFQSIYLQRFLILSAVELKSNQSRKDCSYDMTYTLVHIEGIIIRKYMYQMSVCGTQCVYVVNTVNSM